MGAQGRAGVRDRGVGANVKAVQTMLGHKSAALTLDAVASALNCAVLASDRNE